MSLITSTGMIIILPEHTQVMMTLCIVHTRDFTQTPLTSRLGIFVPASARYQERRCCKRWVKKMLPQSTYLPDENSGFLCFAAGPTAWHFCGHLMSRARKAALFVAATLGASSGLIAITADAASFDCSQTGTRVEKMICASAELSRLDGDLAQQYGSLIRSTTHPDTVRSEQRAWVHDVRDRCSDKACLISAYKARIEQLGTGRNEAWRTFHDPVLKIAFSYRPDWVVESGCHGSKSCVAVSAHRGSPDSYLIAFEVFPGDLEEVATNRAIFRKSHDGWTAMGRNGEHPVDVLEGPGWHGIRSVVDCGVTNASGSHPATGQCLWVVASGGKRSVVADTQGTVPISNDIARIIESLQLTPN
jgi:uncharacterized protein